MNAVRYGTLVEIEEMCKKNKRYAKASISGNQKEIKRTISDLSAKKIPFSVYQELDSQINL